MCRRYRLARKEEILAEIFDAGDDNPQIAGWRLLLLR
jgi:hypothetical protein